jgi:hypothetical protein
VSLKEIKNDRQTAGKGHNETLEIVILLVDTLAATNAVKDHVPENGGTCYLHFLRLSEWKDMSVDCFYCGRHMEMTVAWRNGQSQNSFTVETESGKTSDEPLVKVCRCRWNALLIYCAL